MGIRDHLDDWKRRLKAPTKRPASAGRGSLAALSDEELEEELLRRRRARARARGVSGTPEEREGRRPSPQRKQLAQYYANLELEPGATLEDVQRSYRRLIAQYHPDKHLDDPERHRAATELAQSLTQAYHELSRILKDRQPKAKKT